MPSFSLEAQVKSKRTWRHDLSPTEEAEANLLLSRVASLHSAPGEELTGIQLICTFLKRRVQPLQARPQAMWMYAGLQDPSRTSAEEISVEELEMRVRQITNLKRDDSFVESTAATPFSSENPLPEVTEVPNLLGAFFDFIESLMSIIFLVGTCYLDIVPDNPFG